MIWNSHGASSLILLMQGAKFYIFYPAFINFTNSLWGKYVNQFWLPPKGRISNVVSILEFTVLNVCIIFNRIKIFNSIYEIS